MVTLLGVILCIAGLNRNRRSGYTIVCKVKLGWTRKPVDHGRTNKLEAMAAIDWTNLVLHRLLTGHYRGRLQLWTDLRSFFLVSVKRGELAIEPTVFPQLLFLHIN